MIWNNYPEISSKSSQIDERELIWTYSKIDIENNKEKKTKTKKEYEQKLGTSIFKYINQNPLKTTSHRDQTKFGIF